MDKKILVSGFTFVKHGIKLGYPIKESILSIEPLCDEIVINVGYDDKNLEEDDGTYELLTKYFSHPKFKFVKSYWNPEISSQGLILSEQTNIALKKCIGDYCLYIQGDEVLHENDLPKIHEAVIDLEKDQTIDGLVFNYTHFYGNVDVIKQTRNIYRREVRLIRNNRGIKSWLDAQGFRKEDDSKLLCKRVDANVYHYGWARKEQIMSDKVGAMNKLYHGKNFQSDAFSYKRIWGLRPFNSGHPKVMRDWVSSHKNDLDILKLDMNFELNYIGLAVSDFVEDLTGYRIGEYKNYKLF